MTSDAVSSVLGNAFDQGFSPARQQQHICALRLWQFHFSSFLLCACARLVDALALLLLEASHLFCHVAASHLYCHYAASHVCCHHTASHCCLARTAALPMTQLTGRLKPIVKTCTALAVCQDCLLPSRIRSWLNVHNLCLTASCV